MHLNHVNMQVFTHITPDMITHKPSKWEGKDGVGMTPKNIHYYSDKGYPMKVTMFDHETWSTLWKVFLVKGLQILLDFTLLKDFNTLLEVCLVKGLQLTMK